MKIFGLYITTAKRQRLRVKAWQEEHDKQNKLIASLLADKNRLIKSCEILIQANKNRQQGRALARRQAKLASKTLMYESTATR